MGESRDVFVILVGKREGKRPLGRPRRRWENNFNMILQEMGCEVMHWIDVTQERLALVNAGSIKCGKFLN
jgi:hypothetical protein